jgi:3-oxoacyl-[acyl-carrier protein] reductase
VDLGPKFELRGKRALVTGGSRGIGRGIALAFAAHGMSVAVCYHQESEAVARLKAEIQEISSGSYVVQADVTNEAEVAGMASEARKRLGQIDVLVNNAGVVSHKTMSGMDLVEWKRVLDTNLTAMYLVTRAVLDAMPEGSSIINVGSAVATVGMPGRTHYTASKAGVIGFTRSLCKEVGPRNIRAERNRTGHHRDRSGRRADAGTTFTLRETGGTIETRPA